MKKLLFILLMAVSFLNCENENPEIDATLIGRWHLEGFETAVMYEFTEDKRYTLYSEDGTFPPLDIETHPPTLAHDWVYDGDVVVIDLNFGNFSRAIPNYKCGNYVIDWVQEDGSANGTIYREDYDISGCDE